MKKERIKRCAIAAIVGFILTIFVLNGGCQWFARSWGGTVIERLPRNVKLVNVTWKTSNLWILTKPMTKDDVAETYEFRESSLFGALEGKVIIFESK
jgi:hypothetical protein